MLYEVKELVKVGRPVDVVPVIRAILDTFDHYDQQKEHFFVVGLNSQHKVTMVDLVTTGLIDQTQVHPREVFCRLITKSCSAFIVSHNHPSNKNEPSKEDNAITQQLRAAGDLLGITLLDHVILCDTEYYSFAEENAL